MTFPEFSNYQDVFANPLSPTLFALFEVPGWIPQPPQMLRLAQLIYPYWKERRLERGGHRIIPTLNVSPVLPFCSLFSNVFLYRLTRRTP